MSRTDLQYLSDAEDAIRMMRFMSRNIKEEKHTVDMFVSTYKKLYPDWEIEDEKEHYFFLDITFIDDAIRKYSEWLKITADDWEEKINEVRKNPAREGD